MNRTRAYPDYRLEHWLVQEGSMSRWYAVAEEASFKPVDGGYIFQPYAFEGDGRNRLVNEAQKAAITSALRRSRLVMLIFAALGPPLMMGLGIGLIVVAHAPLWLAVAAIVLLSVVFGFSGTRYRRRKLRPLISALPITAEHITFRERIETMARKLPRTLLGIGLGLGLLAMLFNILAAVYEQRFPSALLFVFSAAITTYFAWLIVLRIRHVTSEDPL